VSEAVEETQAILCECKQYDCRASAEIPLAVGLARTDEQIFIATSCPHLDQELARGQEDDRGDSWILLNIFRS